MSWKKTRSQIANTKRYHPDADTTDLQRQLKAERLADHIERTVDAAPPLTPAQRAWLVQVLSSGITP